MGRNIDYSYQFDILGRFSPFKVGNPIVFLDASRGITLNGADVSIWADQSGNGNDVTQGTAADQPLWNASDSNFNGQPSLTFDGISEFISRAAFVGGSISQPNTIFIVYKLADNVGNQLIYTGPTVFHILSDNSGLRMQAGAASQVIFASDTNVTIMASLWNQASSIAWRDGVESILAATVGANPLQGFELSTGSFPMSGEVACVLVYNSNLSDAAKNYIGNGLAAKYGTTWSDI